MELKEVDEIIVGAIKNIDDCFENGKNVLPPQFIVKRVLTFARVKKAKQAFIDVHSVNIQTEQDYLFPMEEEWPFIDFMNI